jgi:hypothetical protein
MIKNRFFSIFILPFFHLGANNIHVVRRQILLVGPLFEFRFPRSFAIDGQRSVSMQEYSKRSQLYSKMIHLAFGPPWSSIICIVVSSVLFCWM